MPVIFPYKLIAFLKSKPFKINRFGIKIFSSAYKPEFIILFADKGKAVAKIK